MSFYINDNKISFELNTNINFIKIRKIAYIISIVVFLIGGGIFIARGYNYGIDFTGGTMMHVDMHKVVDQDKLKSFLKKNDVAGEVIYAGKANKEVIVRTRKHLDRASKMFYTAGRMNTVACNTDVAISQRA